MQQLEPRGVEVQQPPLATPPVLPPPVPPMPAVTHAPVPPIHVPL